MKKLIILTALILSGLSLVGEGAYAQANLQTSSQKKVLRYAFRIAETGFDPAKISDIYSRIVAANIFEAPLEYAYLERPIATRPNTAVAMPEISSDFRTLTFKIKPGIYFNDDPAFKGKKRELVAQDYVYAIKRFYDPVNKAPNLYALENSKIIGLTELRKESQKPGAKFDYDKEVEGARALDRYTFQVKLAEPDPRFYQSFADPSVMAGVAREVVEFYGDRIAEHPVGTGPYRLVADEWRRSSKIVLEKNPSYRGKIYDEKPPPDDPVAQAIAEKMKGKQLPLIDRIEIAIIEENQPRWLSFLSKDFDMVEEVPFDYADIAMPNNVLAPNLKKQGIVMDRYKRADIQYTYFNMDDKTVGGNSPEKVALRRAISLSRDLEKEVRLVRRNQAIVAQSVIPPLTFPYDDTFKTEGADYDPQRAKALLDMYGYVDKNGDGWREMPDGKPLELIFTSQPDDQSRQLAERWQKDLAAVGLRMKVSIAKWPENLKQARAGKLMMWRVGWNAAAPDAENFAGLAYGPNGGQSNLSRFKLKEIDDVLDKQRLLPDNDERKALIQQAAKLIVAYVPFKVHTHQIYTDMYQPWLIGAKRNIFVRDFWRYVDIDTTKLPK
jgi:ABC-type transport system substrate-binding protein